MRKLLRRKPLAALAVALAAIGAIVGTVYALDYGGQHFTNVGSISIGSSTGYGSSRLDLTGDPVKIWFHGTGDDDGIHMGAGNDGLYLGYGNDKIDFVTGDAQIMFGGDWPINEPPYARIQFLDDDDGLDMESRGPVTVQSTEDDVTITSANGDVIIRLGQ